MSYKGGCRAEFGIIDHIDPLKNYGDSYEPEKYGCIAICDDVINEWWDELKNMKSYFHCLSREETALDRWGVTLIPPESLNLLINVIQTKTSDDYKEDALEIVELLIKAKEQSRYIIHYGI